MNTKLRLYWVGMVAFVTAAHATDLPVLRSIQLPKEIRTVARWSGGAVLVIKNEHSAAPTIEAYDGTGARIQQFTLTIPGAQFVSVLSGQFARSANGALAIAGIAYDGQNHATNFLALVGPGGAQQTIVRTDPYFAMVVAIAPDGSVWTAGEESVLASGATSGDGAIIRRFSLDGKSIGGALPTSALAAVGPGAASQSRFAVSGDRVVWYSPNRQLIVEFGLDGTEMGRFSATLQRVKGIALCADDSLWTASGGQGGSAGNAIEKFDRSQGKFSPVSQFGSGVYLYGCDDNALVTGVGHSFSWLQVK